MKRKPLEVYGLLILANGKQIDMDGEEISTIDVKPTAIVGYGKKYMGDEANVFALQGERGLVLTNVKAIRQLFTTKKMPQSGWHIHRG